MIDVTPQALVKDVVKGPAASVQADLDILAYEHACEVDACELYTSVAVEDVGLAKVAQRLSRQSRRSMVSMLLPICQLSTLWLCQSASLSPIYKPVNQAKEGDAGAPDLVVRVIFTPRSRYG